MKKPYFAYIGLLAVIFLSGLILWPQSWINLDIGSFHYHKEWKGLDLEDLTFDTFKYDFHYDLGIDFDGGSEYKLAVNGDDNEELIAQTVTIIRNRLDKAGYAESTVHATKIDNQDYIYVTVRETEENFSNYENLLVGKGVFELWGEKSDEEIESSVNDTLEITDDENPIKAYLSQQYKNVGVNINEVKGARVKEDEEGISVTVALTDEDSEEFMSVLTQFYGKTLFALLDEHILPIDGAALGEQVGFYGEPKTVILAGIEDEKLADVYSALITSGHLPTELEIKERQTITPSLGDEFLKTGLLVACGLVIALLTTAAIMYKKDGIVAGISLLIFCLLFVLFIKVLPIRITLISVILTILNFVLFILLRLCDLKILEVKNKESFVQMFMSFAAAISLVLVLFGPALIQSTAMIMLIGVTLIWLFENGLFKLIYKLIKSVDLGS